MPRLKIFAMIPARRGSTRLKEKNLAMLVGKPLIAYAIEAALTSTVFDRVIVNSEDEIFRTIAQRYGAQFYHRPKELGSSDTKSDQVIYDFLKANPCDVMAWVNPTSPLQSGAEIKGAVDHFIKEGLDSLITVKNEQVHTMFKGQPLNFKKEGLFAKTQDLEPVQPFVYSVMMWKSSTFIREYNKKGHALLCGKFGTYAVSRYSSIIIKKEEDLKLAEFVLTGMRAKGDYQLQYDEVTTRA